MNTERQIKRVSMLGNEYWRLAKRQKKFSTPRKLWESAHSYFEWATSNPIIETRVVSNGTKVEVEKPRAFTVEGLCLYLGISKSTWSRYSNEVQWKEYHETAARIQMIIDSNQYELAAAGLLRADIVSRKLGLADKQLHQIEPKKESNLSNLSDEQLQQYWELQTLIENGQQTRVIQGNVQEGKFLIHSELQREEARETGASPEDPNG